MGNGRRKALLRSCFQNGDQKGCWPSHPAHHSSRGCSCLGLRPPAPPQVVPAGAPLVHVAGETQVGRPLRRRTALGCGYFQRTNPLRGREGSNIPIQVFLATEVLVRYDKI